MANQLKIIVNKLKKVVEITCKVVNSLCGQFSAPPVGARLALQDSSQLFYCCDSISLELLLETFLNNLQMEIFS